MPPKHQTTKGANHSAMACGCIPGKSSAARATVDNRESTNAGAQGMRPALSPIRSDPNKQTNQESDLQSKARTIMTNKEKPLVDIALDGQIIQSKKLEKEMTLKELRDWLVERYPDIGGSFKFLFENKVIRKDDERSFSLKEVLQTHQRMLVTTEHTPYTQHLNKAQEDMAQQEVKEIYTLHLVSDQVDGCYPPRQNDSIHLSQFKTATATLDLPDEKLFSQRLSNGLGVYNLPKQNPFVETESIPRKNILLLGAQGVGKTKFLNGLVNHLRGTKIQQHHRYFVSQEPLNSVGAPGRTQCIQKISFAEGVVDPALCFIDTPGFSEVEHEASLLESDLIECCRKEVNNKLEMICLVLNSSMSRMDASQVKVYQRLLGVLQKIPSERIAVVLTNSDPETSNAEELIGSTGSLFYSLKPFSDAKQVIKVNLCSLYQTMNTSKISQHYWTLSEQGFQQILKILQNPPCHITLEAVSYPTVLSRVENPPTHVTAAPSFSKEPHSQNCTTTSKPTQTKPSGSPDTKPKQTKLQEAWTQTDCPEQNSLSESGKTRSGPQEQQAKIVLKKSNDPYTEHDIGNLHFIMMELWRISSHLESINQVPLSSLSAAYSLSESQNLSKYAVERLSKQKESRLAEMQWYIVLLTKKQPHEIGKIQERLWVLHHQQVDTDILGKPISSAETFRASFLHYLDKEWDHAKKATKKLLNYETKHILDYIQRYPCPKS